MPPQPRSLWAQPKVMLGFVTIFLVLGAEAGLFSLFRNYLEDPSVAGVSSRASQQLFTVYFAIFAFGRLAGSWIQKRVKPAYTLAFNAVAAVAPGLGLNGCQRKSGYRLDHAGGIFRFDFLPHALFAGH